MQSYVSETTSVQSISQLQEVYMCSGRREHTVTRAETRGRHLFPREVVPLRIFFCAELPNESPNDKPPGDENSAVRCNLCKRKSRKDAKMICGAPALCCACSSRSQWGTTNPASSCQTLRTLSLQVVRRSFAGRAWRPLPHHGTTTL